MQGTVFKRVAWFTVGVLACVLAHASELSEKLQSPDHVLLMRHTLAPGIGDPDNYKLSDCQSQRNLSAEGRQQAAYTGQWLKQQGVSQAEVYSSPWCRCFDTASLLHKGSVKKEVALGSFFDDMSQTKKQTEDLAKLIQTERNKYPKSPIIMVTHHVNIESFTGKILNSGDMILVKVNSSGQAVSHKLYPSPTNP